MERISRILVMVVETLSKGTAVLSLAGRIWWLIWKSHLPVTWGGSVPLEQPTVHGAPRPYPHSHHFLETQTFPICLSKSPPS